MATVRFPTYCWAMNTPVGDERSARQLRNDVDGIYDMLGDINTTVNGHSVTLAGHTVTLAEHSVTLAEHTVTLAGHTVTLAEHSVTLAEHSTILDLHTDKLDQIIGLLETR